MKSKTKNRASGDSPQGSDRSGEDLFFRAVASQVSSALESLTAVFGMGTGVASP